MDDSGLHYVGCDAARISSGSDVACGPPAASGTLDCRTSRVVLYLYSGCDAYLYQYLTRYLSTGCDGYGRTNESRCLLIRAAPRCTGDGHCTVTHIVVVASNHVEYGAVGHVGHAIRATVGAKGVRAVRRVACCDVPLSAASDTWPTVYICILDAVPHGVAFSTCRPTFDQVMQDTDTRIIRAIYITAAPQLGHETEVGIFAHTTTTVGTANGSGICVHASLTSQVTVPYEIIVPTARDIAADIAALIPRPIYGLIARDM